RRSPASARRRRRPAPAARSGSSAASCAGASARGAFRSAVACRTRRIPLPSSSHLAGSGRGSGNEQAISGTDMVTSLMPTLQHLGPSDLRRAVEAFRDALRMHQEELNRLNVYPVPDGDTGTNMALTLESVCGELRTAESMVEVCNALSRGSLM